MAARTAVRWRCGDGILRRGLQWGAEGFEECDDGNADAADGCSATCLREVCGSRIVDPGEACDDGNRNSLMPAPTAAYRPRAVMVWCGRTSKRTPRAMSSATTGTSPNNDRCLDTCRVARCGDGFVREGVEGCDDANEVEADACTNACCCRAAATGSSVRTSQRARKAMRRVTMATRTMTMRASRVASSPGAAMVLFKSVKRGVTMPTPTTVTPAFKGVGLRAGDGFIRAGIEACDDANNSNTDACLTNCTAARCGDGHVRAGVEACDDGNNNNGDGCAADLLSNFSVPNVGQSGRVGVISGANWIICRADNGTAWVAANNRGTYNPTAVCQHLGYSRVNNWGGTCGTVCGYCGSRSERYDRAGGGATRLGVTVHWQCGR